MLVDGTTHKVLLKVTDSGDKGVTPIELMDYVGGSDSMVYKATYKLKKEGKIKKSGDKWFLNTDAKVIEQPSQREVVLNCLLAYHADGKSCSIWDIVTMSCLTKERVSTMMYRVRLKHEVTVEGERSERVYTYVGLKGQKPKKKTEEQLEKALVDRYDNDNSVERCYLLLQALGTVDVPKVAACFDISNCEADKLIRGVITQYDYMLSNMAITFK